MATPKSISTATFIATLVVSLCICDQSDARCGLFARWRNRSCCAQATQCRQTTCSPGTCLAPCRAVGQVCLLYRYYGAGNGLFLYYAGTQTDTLTPPTCSNYQGVYHTDVGSSFPCGQYCFNSRATATGRRPVGEGPQRGWAGFYPWWLNDRNISTPTGHYKYKYKGRWQDVYLYHVVTYDGKEFDLGFGLRFDPDMSVPTGAGNDGIDQSGPPKGFYVTENSVEYLVLLHWAH